MQLQLIETSELEARIGATRCALKALELMEQQFPTQYTEKYQEAYKQLQLMHLEVQTQLFRERRRAPITGDEWLAP